LALELEHKLDLEHIWDQELEHNWDLEHIWDLDLQHDLYLEHIWDLQVALMSDPHLHLVLVQKKMV
jgi:hypothetical protein